MDNLDSAQCLECLRLQAWEDDGGRTHASSDASSTGASGSIVSAQVTSVAAPVLVARLEAADHPACRSSQRKRAAVSAGTRTFPHLNRSGRR